MDNPEKLAILGTQDEDKHRVDIRYIEQILGKLAQFIKAFISQRCMSNGFIYVVDAHFINKIEKKKNFLNSSACVQDQQKGQQIRL